MTNDEAQDRVHALGNTERVPGEQQTTWEQAADLCVNGSRHPPVTVVLLCVQTTILDHILVRVVHQPTTTPARTQVTYVAKTGRTHDSREDVHM